MRRTAKMDYWLNSLDACAKSAPKFIVGTHLDRAEFRGRKNHDKVEAMVRKLNSRYRRLYNIRGVVMISNRSGKGIKELKEVVSTVAHQAELITHSIPPAYYQLYLKIQLLKSRLFPPIMQLADFKTTADQFNVPKSKTRDVLTFLNAIGEVAYFGDDPSEGLADIVFLDPQWLTDMMSSVVTLRHKIIRNGKLNHADLPLIWKPPMYPHAVHPVLLSLLKKFDVLYSLGGEATSLVPCLLSPNKPFSFKQSWPFFQGTGLNQISRVWKFKFLPTGFFSRLFVRTMMMTERHDTDIELLTYWANGMVVTLRKGEETSFLEYRPDDYLLTVHVRSAKPVEEIELFAILIENVNGLIDWFQNQISKVEVPCVHCTKNALYPPTMFSLREIEIGITKGKTTLLCKNEAKFTEVRIDQLAPDVSLNGVKEYLVDFNDLEFGETVVGRGAFASVYKGKLKGSVVAIKKIHAVAAADTSEAEVSEKFEELRNEVFLMSGLNHPNIVGLKGMCMSPFLIVMEYLHHGNLYDFLKSDANLNWQLRLRIARDIAEGNTFLHNIVPPIIHRDLKTPNVLLASLDPTSAVVAKIADFGLSTKKTGNLLKGRNVWNPAWLAPEIMEGKPYTEKADVYSFGIILWELIARKFPFEEYSQKYPGARLETEIIGGIRPTLTCPKVPLYVELAEACWVKAPAKRPSFAEIIAKLAAIQKRIEPGTLDYYNTSFIAKAQPSSVRSKIERCRETSPSPVTAILAVHSAEIEWVWLGMKDGSVSVYDAHSQKLLSAVKGHKCGAVTSMTSAEQYSNIWTLGRKTMFVWNIHRVKVIKKFKVAAKIVVFVPPYHVWVATCSGQIQLYDVKSCKAYKELRSLKLGSDCVCICAVGSHAWIAAGKKIIIVDTQKYNVLETITEIGTVHTMKSVSQEIWVQVDTKIKIFSQEAERLRVIDCRDHIINRFVWINNQEQMWGSTGSELIVFDTRTYLIVGTYNGLTAKISAMAKAGNQLWVGSAQDVKFAVLEL